MTTDRSNGSEMSVVVIVTAFPVPGHRAEVVAAFEAAITGFTTNRAWSSTRCTRDPTGWS
jgi:hypothetical protein